jgi:hypothetical protein
MGSKNYIDLKTSPDAVAQRTPRLASNAAHPAAVLKKSGYPERIQSGRRPAIDSGGQSASQTGMQTKARRISSAAATLTESDQRHEMQDLIRRRQSRKLGLNTAMS